MKEKGLLPGLTEWRAIAALLVVPAHLETIYADVFKTKILYWFPIRNKIPVVFFFCLSGFLITWKLLQEKDKSGSVSLPKFYLRRILRIWPLYYLVVIGAGLLWYFGLLQYINWNHPPRNLQDLFLLSVVLPQYVKPVSFIMAGQVWSLGVEEQFYLVQPLIFKCFVRYWYFLVFLIILGAMLFGKYYGSIAIGSCTAILVYNEPKRFLKITTHRFTEILSLLVLLYLTTKLRFGNENSVDYRYFSLGFSILIINCAFNPKSFYALKSPFLEYLGTISYGIYMYHLFCGALVCFFTKEIQWIFPDKASLRVFVYASTICLTIFLSDISYRYYENFFLRQRKGVELFFVRLKRKFLKPSNSTPEEKAALKTL